MWDARARAQRFLPSEEPQLPLLALGTAGEPLCAPPCHEAAAAGEFGMLGGQPSGSGLLHGHDRISFLWLITQPLAWKRTPLTWRLLGGGSWGAET